jgi:putative redox protein
MVHAAQGGAPYQVEIEAGGHAILADEPPANGGGGKGPDPFELVLSGLAACTLITLRMYAERKQWAGFSISGRFRHRREGGQHLIDRELEVTGVPDAAGMERLGDIVEKTPVTLALKAGFAISTRLNHGAAART